ncbi:Fis family transcriptional regulator, partial [Achromobacter dolens]
YQTHGAVTDFRGKLVLLAHKGSILSKVGASAKPGAIHSAGTLPEKMERFEAQLIREALAAHRGDVRATLEALG